MVKINRHNGKILGMFDGKKLRRLRTEAELSREALAKMVGCDQSEIYRYEIGQYRPLEGRARKIAKALDISLSELDAGQQEANPYLSRVREIMVQLPEAEQVEILNAALKVLKHFQETAGMERETVAEIQKADSDRKPGEQQKEHRRSAGA